MNAECSSNNNIFDRKDDDDTASTPTTVPPTDIVTTDDSITLWVDANNNGIFVPYINSNNDGINNEEVAQSQSQSAPTSNKFWSERPEVPWNMPIILLLLLVHIHLHQHYRQLYYHPHHHQLL